MARPDIAIGDHPALGVVANTAPGVPAAKILLARLGFVRDNDSGLYILPRDEPGQADTRTLRAAHAVSVLRGAHFRVDADIAYEPEPAPAPRRSAEPDVAFGLHPESGVLAAITGERPYAAMILRAAGFTRDPERDVYTLPAGLSHEAASTLTRNTASVLRRTGSTVQVMPGALAPPVPARQGNARLSRVLDGPRGARAMLDSLRRFVQTATAWCAERGSTSAVYLADRLTGTAARLDVASQSLDATSRRLRGTDAQPEAAEHTAPAPKVATDKGPQVTNAGVFDALADELRNAPEGPAAAAVLARATAPDGPLAQLGLMLAAAAQQSAESAHDGADEVTEPLVAASVEVGAVRESLNDAGTSLAAEPAAPAATARSSKTRSADTAETATSVAQAARATPGRRTIRATPPPEGTDAAGRRAAAANVPAAARPAPAARSR
ncbi:hypothetical protein GCM10023205_04330 [Yinghuangia aomiensis]|uniref:Uncharacterized protein n=1 Tax=Yinghuangia aomiensis TaxID=676205 RepID=A0ABP9GMB4_9ACTN